MSQVTSWWGELYVRLELSKKLYGQFILKGYGTNVWFLEPPFGFFSEGNRYTMTPN